MKIRIDTFLSKISPITIILLNLIISTLTIIYLSKHRYIEGYMGTPLFLNIFLLPAILTLLRTDVSHLFIFYTIVIIGLFAGFIKEYLPEFSQHYMITSLLIFIILSLLVGWILKFAGAKGLRNISNTLGFVLLLFLSISYVLTILF